jgi:hypothetical protein
MAISHCSSMFWAPKLGKNELKNGLRRDELGFERLWTPLGPGLNRNAAQSTSSKTQIFLHPG